MDFFVRRCNSKCGKNNRVGSAGSARNSPDDGSDESIPDLDKMEPTEQAHENNIANDLAPCHEQLSTVNEVVHEQETDAHPPSRPASSAAVIATKPPQTPKAVVRVRTDGNRTIKEHIKE